MPVSLSFGRPVTSSGLLATMEKLKMPSLLRAALFGLTANAIGNLRVDAATEDFEHLVTPAQALLARMIDTLDSLIIPMSFPSPKDFADRLNAVLGEPEDLRTVSIALGVEASAASRWRREHSRVYPATAALMALLLAEPSQTRSLWAHLLAMAEVEARARGLGDIWSLGSWGARRQDWIMAA